MGSCLITASMAFVLTVLIPISLFAAASPAKIVVTFGGLNERSGVLFVAKDAGIFQKHGLDAEVSVSAVDR
jgi:ABC-type nitrate/sulfonate/bicarbonate transport system substrate-binding protein